jgi:hypothetical protein
VWCYGRGDLDESNVRQPSSEQLLWLSTHPVFGVKRPLQRVCSAVGVQPDSLDQLAVLAYLFKTLLDSLDGGRDIFNCRVMIRLGVIRGGQGRSKPPSAV